MLGVEFTEGSETVSSRMMENMSSSKVKPRLLQTSPGGGLQYKS